MKHWTAKELGLLAGMRTRFLEGTAGELDYWRSNDELTIYDEVFAARIGWKIDAVIRDLRRIGWSPQSKRILDWGCGTGIASRRILAAWPQIREVGLHDRSTLAVAFAKGKIASEAPQVRFSRASADRDTLLVVSHVLNELSPEHEDELIRLIESAGEVIWIDAGSHAESRRLIGIREKIRALPSPPKVVAPCTHLERCGLLTSENARHWCHHFADPPADVFQSARWSEMSRELGIDLRALPYSYLVLTRHQEPDREGAERIIGVPREAKAFCRVLSCGREGVQERMLQKRDDPATYKHLLKHREFPPYRWQLRDGKIVRGEAFGDAQE